MNPFAQMVARGVAAQNAAEGTVVAVHGPRGIGKSSVVNLTAHHLGQSDSDPIEVVPFKRWWCAGSPASARAFFYDRLYPEPFADG